MSLHEKYKGELLWPCPPEKATEQFSYPLDYQASIFSV